MKTVILLLLSFMFPAGIWLGLEGYELAALICLIFGWVPASLAILSYLNRIDENDNSSK